MPKEYIEKRDELDQLKSKIHLLEILLNKIEHQLAPLKGRQVRGHRAI